MSNYANTSDKTVKVMYKVNGKTYNNGTANGDGGSEVDNATTTFYPWEEVEVAAGSSKELGDVTIVKVVALGGVATSRISESGDLENTGTHDLKVMYRINGKTYNNGTANGDGGSEVDNDTTTFYPWEEEVLPVGKKFSTAGVTVLKTVELGLGPVESEKDRLDSMYSGS